MLNSKNNKYQSINKVCLGIIIIIIFYLIVCDTRKIKEKFAENKEIKVIGDVSEFFPEGIIDLGVINTNVK